MIGQLGQRWLDAAARQCGFKLVKDGRRHVIAISEWIDVAINNRNSE
jgi:hypothetical protein